jgi:hypothetical protein
MWSKSSGLLSPFLLLKKAKTTSQLTKGAQNRDNRAFPRMIGYVLARNLRDSVKGTDGIRPRDASQSTL